ncbi:MAG: trimethylamine methyltransferase family protein [Rhodobacteraceae bacterium]|nr:trimethylamine methyltransferase family protein [Paracoccaceae bacterium]
MSLERSRGTDRVPNHDRIFAPPRHRRRKIVATPASGRRASPVAARLKALSADDMAQIDAASRTILARTGMASAPTEAFALVTAQGGAITDYGWLLFPEALVDAALAGLRRDFGLYGRDPAHDIGLEPGRLHTGSGGASPMIVDIHDCSYRRATLAGTSKHVMTSAGTAAHVEDIAGMCFDLAGSGDAFRARPFLSLNVNHAVPPLRFDPDACGVLIAAARLGLPLMVNTFGQMGASSPVTMAGCLAQTNAETLAGMVLAWLADPRALAVCGARPMVTDLRSGGMAGGSGEQALLTAAASRMAQFYGLPNSTIAGATDSKIADAQAGYENAMAVTMAVQAGANLITQAGLMATSFEAYVIDNDMLGAILSAAMQIEVSAETLAVDSIDSTVRGNGHFLGNPETYARMRSDFVYPAHADRQAPDAWLANGAPTMNNAARRAVLHRLATHFPAHIPADTDAALQRRFDILLPVERMHRPCRSSSWAPGR